MRTYLAHCPCGFEHEYQRQDLADEGLAVHRCRDWPAGRATVGVRRRLQALVAIGYLIEDLAQRLAVNADELEDFLLASDDVASGAFCDAVLVLYRRLWSRPPQQQLAATRAARDYAATQGWATPLEWGDGDIDQPLATPTPRPRSGRKSHDVDAIAVERRIKGDAGVRLNAAEREQMYRELNARGMTDSQILNRTGCRRPTARVSAA